MELQTAQQKIKNAILRNAEEVVSKAITFNPECRVYVEAVRAVNGPIEGVAATAVRYALSGKDLNETNANIIKFAGRL